MHTTTRTDESANPMTEQRAPEPPAKPAGRGAVRVPRIRTALAVVGGVAVLALALGTALDIASIDPTSGGYEPPYTSFSGQPIDWDADTYTTPTGMMAPGYVLDVYTDCTTGMISFEVLGLVTFDYRQVSDRALAVHEPDAACRERGFDPQF